MSRAGYEDVQIEGEAVKGGEIFHRNGRPVADIFPVKAAIPAWKKPPQIRLSLGNLSLGDEVLADRGSDPAEETQDETGQEPSSWFGGGFSGVPIIDKSFRGWVSES